CQRASVQSVSPLVSLVRGEKHAPAAASLPLDRIAACIHGEVRESVGFFVVFATDVLDGEVGYVLDPPESSSVEKADAFVLHLVFAFDLFNYELRIGEDLKLFATRIYGKAQRRQKGRI